VNVVKYKQDSRTHSVFMDEECCHGNMIPSHSIHEWSDTTAVWSVGIVAAPAKSLIESWFRLQCQLFCIE